GGIQGGISNGEPVIFNVAFKPVATLMRPMACINAECQLVEVAQQGRHDPCVVPRAVPVVEAMTALVILDNYLKNKTTHI
ncbi:MAG: chorismate synthase, partial [Muribaculaceae bacterium]|nr:chorismate synthase [Muribaculaceae bacterium]